MTVHEAVDVPVCGCGDPQASAPLCSVERALELVVDLATPVSGTDDVALTRARGRVLAAPLRAAANTPPFDNAAMDGYAIRSADLIGPGPWRLALQDHLAAGDGRLISVSPGRAVRIMTGAAVPTGADAVLMQESVKRDPGGIGVTTRPQSGQNIRRAGEDMAKGDIVLPAGQRLTPVAIGTAAAAGADAVTVRRKIRVTVLVTGDETRRGGAPLAPGAIWDVNTPMLAAALDRADVELSQPSQCRDNLRSLANALQHAAATSDLIFSTGGVSVGDADHMHDAVLRAGGEITFAGVAMKPGKPVSAGRIGRAVWIGLPGNPVSAYIAWALFGRPVLDGLTGATPTDARTRVRLAGPVEHKPGRCEFRPARVLGQDRNGRLLVATDGPVHSARMTTIAGADGVIVIPAEADALPRGALVDMVAFQ